MLTPVCMGLRDERTDHSPRYLDGLTQYPSMLESDDLTVPMIWLLYPITLSRFVRSIETLIALQLHYLPTRIPEPEFLTNRIDFRIILRRQRTPQNYPSDAPLSMPSDAQQPPPQIPRQRNLRRRTPPHVPNLVQHRVLQQLARAPAWAARRR